MKLLLLGATGVTGSLLVQEALDAEHEVVAYVRTPGKITPRAGLEVVKGDVTDYEELAAAMQGVDATISTLGLSTAKPNGFSEKAVSAITQAAEQAGTRRVLIMSAFGVGSSADKASGLARLMYKAGGKAIYADKAAGEKILKASSLHWTLIYPVLLTNNKSSGFRAIDLDDLDRLPGVPRVSRADVARFLLHAATDEAWSRRTAVLTTTR